MESLSGSPRIQERSLRESVTTSENQRGFEGVTMIEAVGGFETQTCAAKFTQYILLSIGELRGCSPGVLAVLSSTVYFHKTLPP